MTRKHKKLVLKIKENSITLVQNAQVVGGELIVLEAFMIGQMEPEWAKTGQMQGRWTDSPIDVGLRNMREITACFLNLAANSWIETDEILGTATRRQKKKLVSQIKDRSLTLIETQELIASELLTLEQAFQREMAGRWKDSSIIAHFQNVKEIMTGYQNLSGPILRHANEILGE